MILLLAALLLAPDTDADAQRAAWRYRREVVVPKNAKLVALTLPPELSVKANALSRDLRLIDDAGREVPFILDWTSEREGLETFQAAIADIRREKESGSPEAANVSTWTVDLGAVRAFTEINLDVPDVTFAWHVRVETSMDGSAFRLAHADASLFDQDWNGDRVRKTMIAFDTPLRARSIRITARSAADSPTLELNGASVTLRRRLKADQWSVPAIATLEGDGSDAGAAPARYRLDLSSLLPFDEVEVGSEDAAFSRHARLIEETDTGGRKNETVLGEGALFRLRSNDSAPGGERTTFRTRNGSGGALILEMDNRGSPPLRGVKVRLGGARVRLLFPASGKPLTLYYGNTTTRAVSYDLEGLRSALIQAVGKQTATLRAERLNPLFKREPPLRFPAAVAAPVDASRWQKERKLNPLATEDVYSLTLRADDLAALQPDLSDLRIVDAHDRQIPYLIDHGFAEERVALVVTNDSTSSRGISRFRLEPERRGATSAHPPVVGEIELDIADPFFDRSAHLRSSDAEVRRDSAFPISLSRRPPVKDLISIATRVPLGALTLEIDDGDNAPLSIRAATGIVRVPRIVFKAAPGALRLLLGHAGIDPPRYDISGLRSELLAYSAIFATAGALGPNEGGSPSLADRLDGTSPRVIVWGAILFAIAALIAITLKTIRKT